MFDEVYDHFSYDECLLSGNPDSTKSMARYNDHRNNQIFRNNQSDHVSNNQVREDWANYEENANSPFQHGLMMSQQSVSQNMQHAIAKAIQKQSPPSTEVATTSSTATITSTSNQGICHT